MINLTSELLNIFLKVIRHIAFKHMHSLLLGIALILGLIFPPGVSAAPLLLHDVIIDKDTSWSGEIIIDGVVVVSRKAILRISAGSKISFIRKDRNNDGIGDGELRILGGIIANGTQKSPIVFESSEEKKSPKDWSYLLIFTSPATNHLSWCEFHHAFSGLQVHFSSLIVENCIFAHNNEGLRFGRADLTVKGNSFFANDIGIRFTRMEGPAIISGNDIHHNRIGLFLVPSGQNIRDFFEPDRSGTPWNTGHLQISGNDIHQNSWYNLNLGEKQIWNLDASNNYWGATSSRKITSTIFDWHNDKTLGRVIFEPYARTPFYIKK
ncbi:MAG: hypothetical protein HGB26_01785 [Desulfobulbaceae bacterium]|nr:hypothetical protein [Desulfobulbaceae bacterium]